MFINRAVHLYQAYQAYVIIISEAWKLRHKEV